MNRVDRPRVRRSVILLTVATVATVGALAGCGGEPPPPANPDRQAEVAEHGASVMPFDLDRTTHQFRKTDSGGVQTVVADDPRDTTQINLIREHLRDEADRFRRGDFADPTQIHGEAMPGLDALRNHVGGITVDYETTPDGARITYTTTDEPLIVALHAWFDAQVSDHGQHADHG